MLPFSIYVIIDNRRMGLCGAGAPFLQLTLSCENLWINFSKAVIMRKNISKAPYQYLVSVKINFSFI